MVARASKSEAPWRQDRTLPHSLEAERVLIGSVLVNQAMFDRAAAFITADDFFRQAHRVIWSTMALIINEQHRPVDLVTLKQELTRLGQLDECGGPAYIASCMDGVPKSSNAGHYAAIVKEQSTLRALIFMANEVLADAYDAEAHAKDVLTKADRRVVDLQRGSVSSQLVDVRQSGAALYQRIEYNATHKGELRGVETGFASINEETLGWRKRDMVVIAARPSVGKAQPLDAAVLTARGWSTIGQLEIGDALVSPDGRPSRVVGIYPQGEKQVFRCTFKDGRSSECCAEHLWQARHRSWKTDRVVSTAQLARLLRAKRNINRIWIPTPEACAFEARWPSQLPRLDPWLLGALIGDGTLKGSSPYITKTDRAFIARASKACLAVGLYMRRTSDAITYRIVAGPRGTRRPHAVRAAIAAYGLRCLSYEKRIPPAYLRADIQTRLELMRGLMDSDGEVTKRGALVFTTTSRGLAVDMQELARSLGSSCRIGAGLPKHFPYKGERKTGRQHYTCVISHADPSRLVWLPRKRRLLKRRERQVRLNLRAITPTRRAETACIAVSHPSGLYITNDYVVTHNTAFVLNAAIAAAQTGAKIAFFSLEMRREQLENRMLAHLSQVASSRIDSGFLNDDEFARIAGAMATLNDLSIWIDDRGGQTVWDIRSACRRQRSEHGLDLVIIDYVQLMSGTLERRGASRNEEMTDISRRVKLMADELDVPVLLLSQLSRAAENRPDPRPKLTDLRESGSLEQDSDVVCLMHRRNHKLDGVTNFIIEKQRNGPTGTVNITFEKNTQSFIDGGEEPAPEKKPDEGEKPARKRPFRRNG